MPYALVGYTREGRCKQRVLESMGWADPMWDAARPMRVAMVVGSWPYVS